MRSGHDERSKDADVCVSEVDLNFARSCENDFDFKYILCFNFTFSKDV